MPISKWTASAVALFLLVGCADTTEVDTSAASPDKSDATAVVEGSASADSSSSEAGSPDSTEAPSEAANASSQYAALPDGLPDQLVSGYKQVQEMAADGGFEGQLNLAGISQQIASQVAESNPEAANAFFKQAATALRAGRDEYPEELPGSFVGPILYNEACVFAKEGNIEGAEKSLAEAITSGFSDFDLLRTDADMEAVRSTPGFEDKLKQWEVAAVEKAKQKVKDELANAESFPFDFTLNDIAGNEQSLAAHKGKVVIVDIWGTWCPPCRAEIPSFIKLQEKLGDQGFQMLGLNYEGGDEESDLATVTKYVAENGINYPCILGTKDVQSQVPDFGGYPTTLFIDRTGKVRMKAVGLHEYSYLEAIVMELLAEEVPATDAG